jgi:hypothetical protein
MSNPGKSLVVQFRKIGNFVSLTRREVLYAMGAGTITTLVSCGGGNSTASNPPSSGLQPVPSGATTAASVSISSTAAGTIGPAFAGLSYEKGAMAQPLFQSSNNDLVGLFKGLGPSLLRIGGNTVDQTQWNASGAGRTSGEVAPSDIDALAGFLQATGWTVLYGVNLATSTAAAAAAEVAYAAKALGNSLYGIEIGNECDLYGNAGSYFAGNWTLQNFEQRWGQFRTAILTATPSVVITGPASASNVTTWTIPFAQDVGSREIALLTQHYYRGDGQSASSTAAELISPDATLTSELQQLNGAAQQIGIPYRLAETNSFYNSGASGVSNTYASSLWVVDFLSNIALGGGAGANFHGGGNDPYTPIADNDGTVAGVRPEYYGIKLFTLAGQGTLLATMVSAGSLDVTAYTVKSSNGALNLLVVNKDPSATLNLTINCGRSVSSASLLLMTAPALSATTGVTIQGASIQTDGTFMPGNAYALQTNGSTVNCYVNASSAGLISIT